MEAAPREAALPGQGGTHLFRSVDSHTLTTLMTSLTVLRKSCILAATSSAGKAGGAEKQALHCVPGQRGGDCGSGTLPGPAPPVRCWATLPEHPACDRATAERAQPAGHPR